MPRRRTTTRTRRRRFKWGSLKKLLPAARTRKRWWKNFKRAPPQAQFILVALVLLATWLVVNWVYQVARKPTELFFPVSGTLYKTPAKTWDAYGSTFRRHATATMTPELLAALAQVEGSGNPIARTYWRWSLTHKPFDVYKPASSAVGMYQITDGTFEETRRLCIHRNVVVEDGPWNDPDSCWFNALYSRVVPTNAIEMTSAYLDRKVSTITARYPLRTTLQQRQVLATLSHLCGAGAGERYARRGYRLLPDQRCGDHSAAAYINRVTSMQRQFLRLSADD